MAEYSEMKNSKLPWIGSIPSHWKTIRIKHILQNISEKNHPDATVLSLYREHGILPKDSRDDNHNVTSLDTGSYKYVREGELVINKMKAWQGSLGISDYEGIVSPAYYVCRFTSDEVEKKYFHYLIRCKAYAQEFERLSTGMRVGQWDLGIDDFMRTFALIPPYSEQSTIAAYLEKQCGKIDAWISDAKESIEDYKRWKDSLVFEAVTKGLNPNAKFKDSRIDIIGKIPQNWSLRRVRFLCSIMTGNQDTQNAVENGQYPFYVRSPKIERANTYTFDGEGVLMAGDGAGAGRVFHHAFGKYAIHQRVYCFYDFQDVLPELFCYFMENRFSSEMDKGSAKSTVPSVRLPMLQNFRVCLPPIPEQHEIVDYLNQKCTAIDLCIKEKLNLISDLESYKKSMIFETVTGKRKVV